MAVKIKESLCLGICFWEKTMKGGFFGMKGWSLPRVFFCLATKETKMPSARLLGDLLVLDG
jgi:hypothetical protein